MNQSSRTVMRPEMLCAVALSVVLGLGAASRVDAQSVSATVPGLADPARANPAITPDPDFVIGPEDQLSIVFFQNKDMSTDVVVRPDGKISLPLLNEITASGLTPEELRRQIAAEAKRFVQEPNPTVVVRQINSRKVFITGAVEKPGTYALNGPTTVLQLIATAGGVKEYADSRNITIVRPQHGSDAPVRYVFNYKEFIARKSMAENIPLRPGDTVIVP